MASASPRGAQTDGGSALRPPGASCLRPRPRPLHLGLGPSSAMFTPCSRRHHVLLDVGDAPSPARASGAALGGLLHLVGLPLLLGDLAIRLRVHEFSRRRDVADQRVDGLNVVSLDRRADVASGFGLPLAARGQEIEHRVVLRRVPEVVADDGLQHVVHEVLDRTHPGDDLGRVESAHVDDLRHVEVEGEAILRAHGDGR